MQARDKRAIKGLLLVLAFAAAAVFLMPVPWSHGHHHSVKQAACLSNLKQSALALAMYADVNDHRLPLRDSWLDGCLLYAKHPDVTRCPGLPYDSKGPDIHGYAFNSMFDRKVLTGIGDQAKQVLLFDSNNLARNASDPLISLPKKPRHPKGNPVVFADAHARVMPVGSIRAIQ